MRVKIITGSYIKISVLEIRRDKRFRGDEYSVQTGDKQNSRPATTINKTPEIKYKH